MALVVLVGCNPVRTDVTMLGQPSPARADQAEVDVFSIKARECPFDEIAIVTGYVPLGSEKERVLSALKERARELGGDALVGLEVVHSGGEKERAGYTATVVRFTEGNCRT